jgi:uncharacterized protein YukE
MKLQTVARWHALYAPDTGAGFETVDTSGFDDAINSFRRALDLYNEARSLLTCQTKRFLGTWEGLGKDKFKEAYNSINRYLEDDGESLSYIIENLESIRASYLEWDTKMASSMENSNT